MGFNIQANTQAVQALSTQAVQRAQRYTRDLSAQMVQTSQIAQKWFQNVWAYLDIAKIPQRIGFQIARIQNAAYSAFSSLKAQAAGLQSGLNGKVMGPVREGASALVDKVITSAAILKQGVLNLAAKVSSTVTDNVLSMFSAMKRVPVEKYEQGRALLQRSYNTVGVALGSGLAAWKVQETMANWSTQVRNAPRRWIILPLQSMASQASSYGFKVYSILAQRVEKIDLRPLLATLNQWAHACHEAGVLVPLKFIKATSEKSVEFVSQKARYYQSLDWLSPAAKEQVGRLKEAIYRLAAVLVGVLVSCGSRVAFFDPRVPSFIPLTTSVSLGVFAGFAMRLLQDPGAREAWSRGGVMECLKYLRVEYSPMTALSRIKNQLFGVEQYVIQTWDLKAPTVGERSVKDRYPLLQKIGNLAAFVKEQELRQEQFLHFLRTRPKSHPAIANLLYSILPWVFMHDIFKGDARHIGVVSADIVPLMNKSLDVRELSRVWEGAFGMALCEGKADCYEALRIRVSRASPYWITCAAAGGDPALLRQVVAQFRMTDADINVDLETSENEVKAFFLGAQPDNILPQDYSPLQIATLRGHLDMVRDILLPLSKDIGHKDPRGHCLLDFAARSGSEAMFDFYFQNPIYRNAIRKGSDVQSYLYTCYSAIAGKNVRIFEQTLAELVQKIKEKGDNQQAALSSLMNHTAYFGQAAMMDVLRKEQYGVEASWDTLVSAALGGQKEVFDALLTRVNVLSQDQKNYLLYAALQSVNIDPKLVESLMKLGAQMSCSFSEDLTHGRAVERSGLYNAMVQLPAHPKLLHNMLMSMSLGVRQGLLSYSTDEGCVFTAAAKNQKVGVLKLLGQLAPKEMGDRAIRLLQVATSAGKIDVCKYLSEFTDPFRGSEGRPVSAIRLAIWHSNIRAVEHYLSAECGPAGGWVASLSVAELQKLRLSAKELLDTSHGRGRMELIMGALENAIRAKRGHIVDKMPGTPSAAHVAISALTQDRGYAWDIPTEDVAPSSAPMVVLPPPEAAPAAAPMDEFEMVQEVLEAGLSNDWLDVQNADIENLAATSVQKENTSVAAPATSTRFMGSIGNAGKWLLSGVLAVPQASKPAVSQHPAPSAPSSGNTLAVAPAQQTAPVRTMEGIL